MKYTDEQQRVIDKREGNLLVSAAAGSGKTAVLVKRILEMVLDKANPVNIDEFLIVTFTKAAANEMRERIEKAFQEKLMEEPDNAHLQAQLSLVHNAKITTIHGFCLSFMKEHFYMLPLLPGFRNLDENEQKLLKEECYEALLEEAYENSDPDFIDFVEAYGDEKGDDAIVTMIERLYNMANNDRDPEAFLDRCLKLYDVTGNEEPELFNLLKEDYLLTLKGHRENLLWCIDQLNDLPFNDDVVAEYRDVVSVIDELLNSDSLGELIDKQSTCLVDVTHKRPKVAGLSEYEKCIYDACKAKRTAAREFISVNNKKPAYMLISVLDQKREYFGLYKYIKVYVDLTKKFMRLYGDAKIEKNVIDFNDMEHMTLGLLYDREGNCTDIARNYRKNFKEIMIDEYQDSNRVQEAMLTAISTCQEGKNNIFMVGDVKQSIYRFRNAEPGLFVEKLNSYTDDESQSQKISLDKNFRSREQILRFTNMVFETVMKEDLGGINYDDSCSLKYGASYDRSHDEDFKVELILLDDDSKKSYQEATEKKVKPLQYECMILAAKIKELMKSGRVYDFARGDYRPVQYSDMAILVRKKTKNDEIIDYLGQFGIPVDTIEGTGYFDTREFKTMRALLSIIDNNRQDLALATVLLSPIVGLSFEELGILRSLSEGSLYDAVIDCEDLSDNAEIIKKINSFNDLLLDLSGKAKTLSVHELISYIYTRTGYYDYVSMMPGGVVRRQNLDILVEKAIDYEKTSYHGLFQFLYYLSQLKEYKMDAAPGHEQATGSQVSLMTIHKSKGLEFPIVFCIQLGDRYTQDGEKSDIKIHKSLGIALPSVDLDGRRKYENIGQQAIERFEHLEEQAEKLRVLYVQLTRAKEKLYLIGSHKCGGDFLGQAKAKLDKNGLLPLPDKATVNRYLDFMLPAIAKNADKMQDVFSIETLSYEEVDSELLKQEMDSVESLVKGSQDIFSIMEEEIDESLVLKRFAGTYHHEQELSLKNKVSVSEIKHAFMEDFYGDKEEEEKASFLKEEDDKLLPRFMGGEVSENLGALRGTATHRFLECLDFAILPEKVEKDYIASELERMTLKGLMPADYRELISLGKMEGFLNSDIASLMREVAKRGELKKEQPFVMSIDPHTAGIDMDTEDEILTQGIIDVFMPYEDGYMLLDYKTDRVSSGDELVGRYKKQMELYSMAISRWSKKPVKRIVLYSFALSQSIDVNL